MDRPTTKMKELAIAHWRPLREDQTEEENKLTPQTIATGPPLGME
jgi:hypothetical protein